MIKCSKCGYKISEKDKFCPSCGARQRVSDIKIDKKDKNTEEDYENIEYETEEKKEEYAENPYENNKGKFFNDYIPKREENDYKHVEDEHNTEEESIDSYEENDFSLIDRIIENKSKIIVLSIIVIFLIGFGIGIYIFNKDKDDSSSKRNTNNINFTKNDNSKNSENSGVKKTEIVNTEEYIFPYSDVKPLTKNDVANVSKDKLALGRNEIFARHGFVFGDNSFGKYFAEKSWYKADPSFKGEASKLSALERHNIKIILIAEGKGDTVSKGYDADYNEDDYN